MKKKYYNVACRIDGRFVLKGVFDSQKEALDLANKLNDKFPDIYHDYHITETEDVNESIEEANKYSDKIERSEDGAIQEAFVEGAKWQAERMYSEEDLINAFFAGVETTGEGWNGEYANGNCPEVRTVFGNDLMEWLNQYKNI
jgi:hypothetical protein